MAAPPGDLRTVVCLSDQPPIIGLGFQSTSRPPFWVVIQAAVAHWHIRAVRCPRQEVNSAPLPLVNPLVGVRSLDVRARDAILAFYKLHLMHDVEGISVGSAENKVMETAFTSLAMPELLLLGAGASNQALAFRGHVIRLNLPAGGDLDRFAALVREWWGPEAEPDFLLPEAATRKAVEQQNTAALRVLQDATRYIGDAYCRHVTDELTEQRIARANDPAQNEFYTEPSDYGTQLAADLFRLGRFEQFQRCEHLVDGWFQFLVDLLLSCPWGPELVDLLKRHGDDYTETDNAWRPRQSIEKLPDHWRSLVSVASRVVNTAVLLFAGLTGDMALAQEVIDRTDLSFLDPDDLAWMLPRSIPTAVAVLPEVEAQVAEVELKWPLTADNVAVIKHYQERIVGCYLWSPWAPAAAVAPLVAKVQLLADLRKYLNEVSFAPTLDLPPLQVIIQEYLRRSSEPLSLEDRWLWRASLRMLLPIDLQHHAERVLRHILAGQSDAATPEQLKYERALLG